MSINNQSIFSRGYWKEAARQFSDVKMLAFAGVIIALRVAVKLFKIPLAAGLEISLDCYVNSIGSLVYGPLVGLAVGAVSDTVGCAIEGFAGYFPPFILVEMLSSFIFGLFFWRKQNITAGRTLLSKFTVNAVCNILLTSIFNKWYMYLYMGIEKAEAYNIVNLVRIIKNIVLFPIEGTLIVLIFTAITEPLKRLKAIPQDTTAIKMTGKDIALITALTVISVGVLLIYIFWGKDFVAAHNIKLF